jgi:endonuclease/exonuclease/phosphatase family metal-dependent hydrolase
MAIITETFTDTDGRELTLHTGELGASWSVPSALDEGSRMYIHTNRLTKDSVNGAAVYMASGTPAADCIITGTFKCLTDIGMNYGILFRATASTNNFYNFRYNQGSHIWEVRSTVNGVASAAFTGNTWAETLNAGDQRDFEIRVNGSNIEILIAGVSRISGTNANHTTGSVGVRAFPAASTTTGMALDSLSVTNVGSVPNPPSNLSLTVVSASQINLSWSDNSTDEVTFRIERKTGAGGTYAEIGSTTTNVNTYNDTTVSAATTYFYRVRARNTNGDSTYLTEQSGTTPSASAPNAPSALILTGVSGTQVDLSWTDNSTDEVTFRIERKTGAGGTYAEIGTTATNVATYSDVTVSPGTTYFYRVRARNANGDSAYAPEQSITTVAGLPAAPSNLALSAVSARQITLTWTDNSNNELTFKIERKTGAGGTYAQIGAVSANVTKFNDTTTSANTLYFYRVRANNSSGDSVYLTEQSITTPKTVTIYTANVQHGAGTDDITDYSRQISILDSATDIICMQERTTGDNGWTSGLSSTGWVEAAYLENDPSQGDGPSIWYKSSTVTLNAAYTKKLSSGAVASWSGTNVDKAAVAARVTSGGKQFYVVCTHLAWSAGADSNGSTYSAIRVAQIKTLMDWINTTLTGGLDIVIVGDMNFGPDYPREQTFTANFNTGVITSNTHGYVDGIPVTVRNVGGALPGNLASSTTYYTRDVTLNTFKLAATFGGSAITLSSNGTGTNYVVSLQADLITGTYDDLWIKGINTSRAIADWGDRDFSGGPDMPISDLGTRTHDTRRIDYAFLKKGATSLALRGIYLPDLRANCSGNLTGSPAYCPDVVLAQRTGTPDDFGVRPSDHNWLKTVLDIVSTTQSPVVNAGSDQTLAAGATSATLNASITDPSGLSFTVAWTRVSGPNTPTINSPTSVTTNLTGLIVGTYVFRCTATNSAGASDFDDVQVTVPVNQAPVINAGADQTLPLGTTSTTLSGFASDPEGQALSLTWSRVSGPNSPTITTPTAASTTVTGLITGTYVFRLSGSDGTNTSIDDVTISIAAASATASLSIPATAYVGEVVVADGSASTGVNGQIGWSTKRFIDGSSSVFLDFGDSRGEYSKSELLKCAHVYLTAGTFQVTLTVKDSQGVPVSATPQTIVISDIPTATGGDILTLTDQGSASANMTELQILINSAFSSNTTNHKEIRIPNTSSFSGAELSIPVSAGNKYVTIRPVDISWLPNGLKRVTPSMAGNMPKFISPFNNASVIRIAGVGRKYLRVLGCEFKKPAAQLLGSMLAIGTDGNNAPTAYNQLPDHVMFDRCYMHGNLNDDTTRCFLIYANDFSAINCYFEHFKDAGADAQVAATIDGKRQAFVNNWLEGYGENVIWGGAGTNIKFSATASNGTPTSCTLSSVASLNVGDGISFMVGSNRGPWTCSIVRSISGSNITFDQITNQAGTPTAPDTTASAVKYGSTPQDILVARNYLYKSLSFRASGPTYNGIYTVVKNSFELKHAMRVRVVGNIVENMWGNQGQDGHTVLFTPRNQTCYLITLPHDPVTCPEQVNPWVQVRDVQFSFNRMKNISDFMNIMGADNLNPPGLGDESGPSGYTRHITVSHILIEGQDPAGESAQMLLIWPGCKDIVLNHITAANPVAGASTAVLSSSNALGSVSNDVMILNSIFPHQNYGIFGDGLMADNFISTFFPDGYVRYNVISDDQNTIVPNGGQWTAPRAAPRYFIPTIDTGTFVNRATGDYHLISTSPFKAGGATPAADGRDMGVDFDSLLIATSGVVSGDWSTGVNQPPIINAGADKNLPAGTTSTILSGTATDPEGASLTYFWTHVSGPNTPSLVTPTSLSTNVTGLIAGTYVFRLTVSDGVNTVIDDIQVVIASNTLPTVNAGSDQNLAALTTSTSLTGTASDPDGSVVSTAWSKISGPTCTIVSPSALTTSITGMSAGTYVFRLTATDNVGGTNFDEIQVVIPSNTLPIVNAGSDQTLAVAATSTSVTATASDPDGGSVTVAWTRISGPNTPTIVSPTALTTNITGMVAGTYVFRCTATDNEGSTAFDEVQITIPANVVPVVNAGPDQNLSSGNTSATLSATASDPDGGAVTVAWTRTSGPNTPTIVSPTSLSTNITGLIAGTYIFRCTATDNEGSTAFDEVQVSIASPVNEPPVVSAGANRRLPYKVNTVTLTGTATDPEAGSLTKTWTRVSGPNTPTIVSPNSLTTNVTGLIKGVYVFRLTVTDGTNTVASDVEITVPYRRGGLGGSITTGGFGGVIS